MLLPILNFASLYRTAATKAILFRMGVIVSPFHRDGNVGLDRQDHAELELMLGELAEVWPSAGARRVS